MFIQSSLIHQWQSTFNCWEPYVLIVALLIYLLHQSLTLLKSFQTLLLRLVAGEGESRSADRIHPSGPQREHTGLMVCPRSLPLFFPFHTTCAFLHWWSPEVTRFARRSFTGTERELERDGLSHVGSSPWVFFLGNPAHEKGWPATLLFPPALSHVTCTRQKCYLSSKAGLAGPLPFAI